MGFKKNLEIDLASEQKDHNFFVYKVKNFGSK
jgi:hypothetical protein